MGMRKKSPLRLPFIRIIWYDVNIELKLDFIYKDKNYEICDKRSCLLREEPKEAVMSKSYRKYLSQENPEFRPPDWSGFRTKERRCIYDELHSHEYGEVIFPQYYGSAVWSWGASARSYCKVEDIRNNYFDEVSSILNGYIKGKILPKDYRSTFLKDFAQIKNGERPDGKNSCFAWLNTKQAKEAIKNWTGDPIDILYHFTKTGIVEKAVRKECKGMLRK